MKKLLLIVSLVVGSSFLQARWAEIPYKGEFTLKHGMMAVNSKDDIKAIVTKKKNKKAKLWDFFLATLDGKKKEWKRQLFVGRGDENSTVKLAVSRDGAVFIKKPKRQKGREVVKETKKEGMVTAQLGPVYEDLLVRVVDGKQTIIRNFMDDEVTDPSLASRSVSLIDMAAVNKDELWCLLREVKGDQPRRMKDGAYVTTGRARVRTFVEKWDGSSFKQVGKDLSSTGPVSGIAAVSDGSICVFVYNIFNVQDKIFKWSGSAWEKVAIPLGAGDHITSFSVVDARNIWLLLEDGNVYQWNGKALEPRGGKPRFYKIYAAPGVVLVQDLNGKIFQWIKGKEPVGFFEQPIKWTKQFFGW